MEVTALSRIFNFLKLFNYILVKLYGFDRSASYLLLEVPDEVINLLGEHHGTE